MKLKIYGLGCLLIFLSYGCVTSSAVPSASTETLPKQVILSESQELDPSEQILISERGIGWAQLGMTLGQLKDYEVQLAVISPFMVDFDAIEVQEPGGITYYILYPAGETLRDSDPIQFLLTADPRCRTAAGVGPGTSLQQASLVYGEATLSYHTSNESREVVSFANSPAPNIQFRTTGTPGNFAGIYPQAREEYHQTQEFKPDATIGGIFLREVRRRD